MSNPYEPPNAVSSLRDRDVAAVDAAIEPLVHRRRTCLQGIGIVAILAAIACVPGAAEFIDAPFEAHRWRTLFAVANCPLFFGLGVWCLSGQPWSIYAAALLWVFWIAQGLIAYKEIPELDAALAAQPYPYSSYASIPTDVERLGVVLATLPAIVPLAVSGYAMLVDWRIRRRVAME